MGATDPEPRALSSPLRPPSPISAEPRGMSVCHALEDCSLANTLPPLHSQSPLCSLVPPNLIKFALGSSILKNSRCHPVLSATSPGFFPCADFSGADFTGCLLSFTSHLGPISAPSLAQLVEVTYLHVWTQGHSWSSSLVLLCALGHLPGPASAAPSPHLPPLRVLQLCPGCTRVLRAGSSVFSSINALDSDLTFRSDYFCKL